MIVSKFAKGACVAALAASLAMLSGCSSGTGPSGASESSSQSASEPTQITFALDYVPNTNHTGLYVALDKGYYADAGLDVTIVQPPDDGADALVGSSGAQLGMSYQDYMAGYLGSDDPLPVTAIAAVVQHNTSGIISRAGEGIDHAAGLEGKRYGTLDVEVERAIVKSIVESDGGNWDAVEVVPANSTDEIAGLKANMFDAIWCFEGWAGQNAKLQDYPVDYFSIRGVDETFDYYTPVIIANNDFLEADPEAVRAFLAATEKGYLYATEHPEEAASILVSQAPEVDPELAQLSQAFLADQYVADAPYWGYIDPARWDRFYAWMGEEGLVPVEIAEGAGFTNDFLPGSSSNN